MSAHLGCVAATEMAEPLVVTMFMSQSVGGSRRGGRRLSGVAGDPRRSQLDITGT